VETKKIEAQTVLAKDVVAELARHWDRPYDISAGLGGNPEPGSRHVFDLRTCGPSIPEIMRIEHWTETGEDQPDLMVMLNNLVVRGELPGAMYVVIVPYPSW